MQIQRAPDVARTIVQITKRLPLDYIKPRQISCMRSFGSSSQAKARIWSFPRIWQLALGEPPHYVIEVLAEHFDKLSEDQKIRILIHELMHIPKNFSGALVPHRGIHKKINPGTVEELFRVYKQASL